MWLDKYVGTTTIYGGLPRSIRPHKSASFVNYRASRSRWTVWHTACCIGTLLLLLSRASKRWRRLLSVTKTTLVAVTGRRTSAGLAVRGCDVITTTCPHCTFKVPLDVSHGAVLHVYTKAAWRGAFAWVEATCDCGKWFEQWLKPEHVIACINSGQLALAVEDFPPDDVVKRWMDNYGHKYPPFVYKLTRRHEEEVARFGEVADACPPDLFLDAIINSPESNRPLRWIGED